MIIEKLKTVGILENYHFDYDVECYEYDLTMLTNGNLIKDRHYADEGDISVLFSKEIQEAFNKSECTPLPVKITAKYIHYPENPKKDTIELEYISRKNGPKIDAHRIETFTGIITSFERSKYSDTEVCFKISSKEEDFNVDIDMLTGIDLTKPVTVTLCRFLAASKPFKTYEITDIKNA